MPIGLRLQDLAHVMPPPTDPLAGTRVMNESLRGLGNAFRSANEQERLRQAHMLNQRRQEEVERAALAEEARLREQQAATRRTNHSKLLADAHNLALTDPDAAQNMLSAAGYQVKQEPQSGAAAPGRDAGGTILVPSEWREEVERDERHGRAPAPPTNLGTAKGRISMAHEHISRNKNPVLDPPPGREPLTMPEAPVLRVTAAAEPAESQPKEAPASPRRLVHVDPQTGEDVVIDYGALQDRARSEVATLAKAISNSAPGYDADAANQLSQIAEDLLPGSGWDAKEAMGNAITIYNSTAERQAARDRARIMASNRSSGSDRQAARDDESKATHAYRRMVTTVKPWLADKELLVDMQGKLDRFDPRNPTSVAEMVGFINRAVNQEKGASSEGDISRAFGTSYRSMLDRTGQWLSLNTEGGVSDTVAAQMVDNFKTARIFLENKMADNFSTVERHLQSYTSSGKRTYHLPSYDRAMQAADMFLTGLPGEETLRERIYNLEYAEDAPAARPAAKAPAGTVSGVNVPGGAVVTRPDAGAK